ncbi:MAG: ABC transporter ATP-binding protein [Acidobacteria bacterium]|nr:ABC transporter ATP-binding protein [Acidobacteriota bacterium]
MAQPKNIVEMRGISRSFGSVQANRGINLAIPAGTIHAIVGENGAGKSTAMKILYGFHTADEGEILVDGLRREIRSPQEAIRLGIGMVHQHFMLVPPLTVLENVILGAEPGSAWRIDFEAARAAVAEIIADFGFDLDPDERVEALSVGQQQRVELVRALYRGARILILDEPTAVLSPPEVEEFFRILRSMRDRGRTVIIITHKLNEVLAISDNVTVMRDGQVVGERRTAATSAAELARLMVGRDVLLTVGRTPARPGESVLEVERLGLGDKLRDVSLKVCSGEIVGIAGVEGNGQTELIEVLAGLRRADRGRITFEGREIGHAGARLIREQGIAHVPEDRHQRGLILQFDLAENSILGVHHRPPAATRAGILDLGEVERHVIRLIREFDIRPPNPKLPARALSGGNQQKLVIGREFSINPRLLLVSQPTRGVDIGAIEFIHGELIGLRDRGAAILLVSAELDEILALADRVLVMYQGRISGEVAQPREIGASTSLEEIGMLMTGGTRVEDGTP